MIWILLYFTITIIGILVCYMDAKEYHYSVKFFLKESFFATILTPFTAIFLIDRLIGILKIKFPKARINTDFITKFLNKKL